MEKSVKIAESGARAVGFVTALFGVSALGAPAATGRAIGIQDDRGLRIFGAIDIAVAGGLLFGRVRWPWLVARAVCNPPTAVYLVLSGRRSGRKRPHVLAGGIMVATIADLNAVRVLRPVGR